MFELIDSYKVTVLSDEAMLVEIFHSKIKTSADIGIGYSDGLVCITIKGLVNDELLLDDIDVSFRNPLESPLVVLRYAYRTKVIIFSEKAFSDVVINFMRE